MNIKFIIILFLFVLFSCKQTKKESITSVLRYWENREISFPNNLAFTIQGEDTVNCSMDSKFRIISYIDSTGCTSCRLKLNAWKSFMSSVNSSPDANLVQLLFFISSKDKEGVRHLLSDNRFEYPVCIDRQDSINILNKFPKDMAFQTFLLDEKNRVLAIGNPIQNPRIKELYRNIISGKQYSSLLDNQPLTTVSLSSSQINLGNFSCNEERQAEFVISNTGETPLVVIDVVTSCGCTTVEYSKAPIPPGRDLTLKVKYKADHSGYFNKTITVHCNTADSPLKLKITGNAK